MNVDWYRNACVTHPPLSLSWLKNLNNCSWGITTVILKVNGKYNIVQGELWYCNWSAANALGIIAVVYPKDFFVKNAVRYPLCQNSVLQLMIKHYNTQQPFGSLFSPCLDLFQMVNPQFNICNAECSLVCQVFYSLICEHSIYSLYEVAITFLGRWVQLPFPFSCTHSILSSGLR